MTFRRKGTRSWLGWTEFGQALRFAGALAKGQPDGGRIALTLFRDKLDELFWGLHTN